MICNNCKKEITDDSKFCEHCGNSIIKRKSDNRLIIDKRIILIIVFPLIGIVVTCIGMHIYKNSNGLTTNPINTSNQDIKNNVKLDVSVTNMYNEVEQENKKSETLETSKDYDTITEQDKQTQNYDTSIEQNIDKDNDSNNSYQESKPFSMPYLKGYSEEYARDVMKQCGLKANFIYAPDSNQLYGIVLSQSVEPNELVYEGETISVTINNDIKTSELTLSIWPFDFVPKDIATAKVVIIINDNIVFEKNVNLDSNATMESTVVEKSFDLYNENKIQVLINEKEVYTNTKNFGVNGNSNDRWVITKF